MVHQFFELFTTGYFLTILGVLVKTAPLWGPPLLIILFWKMWSTYVQVDFISKQEHTLLEIRLPREQEKSPLAMEVILNALHQTGGEGNFIAKYWKGGVRPWFSLELVSIGGNVHFYIWTRTSFKKIVEYNIYAQLPTVEVHEVSDYASLLAYDTNALSLWGCEFDLNKPSAYPIKTYVDYGLTTAFRFGNVSTASSQTDPLANVIEMLGSLGPGEQMWIQFLIQGHKKTPTGGFLLWRTTTTLGREIDKEISAILSRDASTKYRKEVDVDGRKEHPIPALAEEEMNTVKAMSRKGTKLAFDVGMRGLYISERDSFNAANVTGLTTIWKQFGAGNLNGFRPVRGLSIFDYPWQDFKDFRKNAIRKKLFDAYRKRSYFHPPYPAKPFILNTEEIATLYHFPGSVVQTPLLERIDSKRGEPPSNLPV